MTKLTDVIDTQTLVPNNNLLNKIQQDIHVNVNLCYQCSKCSAGCPMSFAMDYQPAQLIHAIRLGITDLVFHSKTMWMCSSCETCTTRCPQEVDVAKVMNTCKIMASELSIKPPIPKIHKLDKAVMRNIKWFGRVHELAAISDFKMRTFEFSKDFGLGIQMILKGKLNLFPSLSVGRTTSSVKIFSKIKKKKNSGSKNE